MPSGEYKVLSPDHVKIHGNKVLGSFYGEYKVFKQGNSWIVKNVNTQILKAVVDLDNNISVSGAKIEVLGNNAYKVWSSKQTPVSVKTLDGKTILENAKGEYTVFKDKGSWVFVKRSLFSIWKEKIKKFFNKYF